MDSIPGSGRSLGEGNGNPLSILAWKILWTEEPGGLQSFESQNQTCLSTHGQYFSFISIYISIDN